MTEEKLLNEYLKLSPDLKKLYIVPLINYKIKNTDYLYLLYKNFIEKKINILFEIEYLPIYSHPKFFFKKLSKEKSLLHYHWFEAKDFKSFLGIFWKIFWIALYKLAGGKIIWTVHNKFPHTNNYRNFNKIVRKNFAHLADKIHVHCQAAIKIMAATLKVNEEKFFVAEHPNYPATIINSSKAKELLIQKYPEIKFNNSERIFLSFGAIAEYKGLIELINLFQDMNKVILIIAGAVKKGNNNYYKKMLSNSKAAGNIFIINKLIPEDEVYIFLNSADFTVYNFENVLTSGSVILGLSYGKKVIAPALGCINDISDDNLILFEKGKDNSSLKNILIKLSK